MRCRGARHGCRGALCLLRRQPGCAVRARAVRARFAVRRILPQKQKTIPHGGHLCGGGDRCRLLLPALPAFHHCWGRAFCRRGGDAPCRGGCHEGSGRPAHGLRHRRGTGSGGKRGGDHPFGKPACAGDHLRHDRGFRHGFRAARRCACPPHGVCGKGGTAAHDALWALAAFEELYRQRVCFACRGSRYAAAAPQ